MKYIGIGSLVVVAFFLLIVGPCTWAANNSIVSAQNQYEAAWGNVEAAYQRRLDTIPKFAETAKFSVAFQLRLNEDYVRYREGLNTAAAAKNPDALQAAADEGLAALIIAVRQEAVPQAKTDQLTELNAQIENVERVVNHERSAYNEACRDYRNNVRTFPGGLVAGWRGFSADACVFFKAAAGAEQSPNFELDLP